ncbi:hypothetical protein Tco_0121632 [Tanacetum coccineum]
MDDIIQPLISKTIHTTPLDKDYVASATKSILNDLLEEFRDEILNLTMVDEGAECSPTKDLEELKRLLAKDPQSHYTEIQVHSVIINLEPFIHTQLMSPLYRVFKTSKPCKVDRDIISLGRYDFYSSCPYPVAYLHPNGVYCYFHPHLIPKDEHCGYVLWKPSRDFTCPLGPPSALKGLLHTINAAVIPTKLYSESSSRRPSESKEKTQHKLRQFLASEERCTD